MKNRILLFIPGYNCEAQITRVLDKISSDILSYITEIIFINNLSTDNTERKVIEYKNEHKKMPIKVLRNDENYNLGGSHKVAFNYARANKFDYIIVLHGDDQANIQDISNILKSSEYEKYDAMLGSRFMKGSKLYGYSKFRTFGNVIYNFLFSIVTKKRISDLGSGLNMYKVSMLENNFYYNFPDRLTFNYLMILASDYYNHNIKFFPITWSEQDQVSNVKMVSQATNVLKILLKYATNHEYIKNEFRDKVIDEYSFKIIS